MDGGRVLEAVGLVRQARPAGFCPACRVLMNALDARPELAKPMVAALVVLAVAGVAWAVMVHHSRAMAGMDMGLGPIESFAATWVVMMAAMMLPAATPMVLIFASAQARRQKQVAVPTWIFIAGYMIVWAAAGVLTLTGAVTYAELGVRWLHSYANAQRTRTYCLYEAPSEEAVRQAAARNGIPVDAVTEVPVDLLPW